MMDTDFFSFVRVLFSFGWLLGLYFNFYARVMHFKIVVVVETYIMILLPIKIDQTCSYNFLLTFNSNYSPEDDN